MTESDPHAEPVPRSRFEERFLRFLGLPRLGFVLAGIAMLLASPCLFIGFWLDDYVARYIYSDLEGGAELFRVYVGGYGIASGVPSENLWQVEEGHAPWWIYPELLIRLFRPVSLTTHLIDGWFWIESAFLMHAHSLLWLGLLVLAMTRLYRGILGPVVGGLAALVFALDHTHGFEVGFICNRHALVAATFGVLCLEQHHRFRAHGDRSAGLFAAILYAIALLAGELSLAIGGYLFAYALFADRAPLSKRALSFAPYLAITLVWRIGYNAAGFGASGSGLYLDPGREPLNYALAFLERAPILLLGQFLAPPAEAYPLFGPNLALAVWGLSALFVIALGVALAPLLSRSRTARFWLFGVLVSLVPAASTHPHNRNLLMASIGAFGLVAELWNLHAVEWRGVVTTRLARFSAMLGGVVLLFHLVASPLSAPFATCSVVLSKPVHRGIDDVGDEIAGRDVVFVTAPDYWAPRLVQLHRRVERLPLPRRWRALSFGPQPVRVTRIDEQTLDLDYEGGILETPFMELYRDRRLGMHPGDRTELGGLSIEVREVTEDGRLSKARFSFDTPLDSPSFVFYVWRDGGFEPFDPPPVGESVDLPPALLSVGLK